MPLEANLSFCVVGDLIIDYYRILCEKRLSPEAPVVIFEPSNEEYRFGGSANVASNICSMAYAKSDVRLVTAVGKDWDELELYKKLPPLFNINLIKCKRQTTIKERLITKRQQIARIDFQSAEYITADDAVRLSKMCHDLGDVLVLSDYEHGVMHNDLCSDLISRANALGVPIVVNSKAKDTVKKYHGATILVLNHNEAREITGSTESNSEMAHSLLRDMGLKAVAITMGADGILLALSGFTGKFSPPEGSEDEVVDVTGAGDTVTAAIALGIARGMGYSSIMRLANVAAGLVIRKRGVATVPWAEVMEHYHKFGGDEDDKSKSNGERHCEAEGISPEASKGDEQFGSDHLPQ